MNQIEEQVQQEVSRQQDPSMLSSVGTFVAESADDILDIAIDNGAALATFGGELLSGVSEVAGHVASGVGELIGAIFDGL